MYSRVERLSSGFLSQVLSKSKRPTWASAADLGVRPTLFLRFVYTWARRELLYCPQCRVAYRAGSAECSDCKVPLLDGAPPREAPDAFDPALGLVVVLETNNGIQLALARGLLQDAGIPFFVLGQIATLVQDVDPFLRKWVRLQVPKDREVEARELLEPLLKPLITLEAVGEDEGGESF